MELRFGVLFAVRENFLVDDERCAVFERCIRLANCRIDAFDLRRFHDHISVFVNLDDGCGIEHSLARAVSFAVMLFNVHHLCALADVE